MPGHIHHIVHTASDPVVSLVITPCAITRELLTLAHTITRLVRWPGTYIIPLVHAEVSVHIPLVCAPDGASHAGPRLLEGKHALDVVAVDFFAGDRVDEGGLDAKEGERGRSRLGRGNTAQWCNDVRARLGLPVCLRRSELSLQLCANSLHLRLRCELPPCPPPRSTISRLLRQLARLRTLEHAGSSSGA